MNLKVVGTGSSGNAYILEADGNKLILDAGISLKEIIKAGNGLNGVEGCLITHEHKDHSRSVMDMLSYGVDCYATKGTAEMLGIGWHSFWHGIDLLKAIDLPHFTVLPFPTEHDAQEPCGFLIRYKPDGTQILYATDTYYLRNTFPNINFWIIECNYSDDLLKAQDEQGLIDKQLVNRLRKSHMSLARLKQTLKSNDLESTIKILLVHLSDGRSNEEQMVKEIHDLTGIETIALDAGMVIDMNLTPF